MRFCVACRVIAAAAVVGLAGSAVAQEPGSNTPLPESIPMGRNISQFEPPYAPPYSPFPGLVYNYYHPQPGSGTMPARLYLSPLPVPLNVGYTYITYQPLAPHEFLWQHQRSYYRYHPGSGYTVTTVSYR